MTKTLLTGTCATLAGLATATMLSAQTTTSQPPQTPAPATAGAEKTITVVGCLRPAAGSTDTAASTTTAGAAATAGTTGTAGSTSPTGTGGAAGTTTAGSPAPAADAAQQKFILQDASVSAADAGTTSTAGAAAQTATATAPQSGQKQTYRLVANGSALSPHVGKKLELTGTLEANSSTATDSTSGPDAGKPMLRVQSGRVIAASCDQQ